MQLLDVHRISEMGQKILAKTGMTLTNHCKVAIDYKKHGNSVILHLLAFPLDD